MSLYFLYYFFCSSILWIELRYIYIYPRKNKQSQCWTESKETEDPPILSKCKVNMESLQTQRGRTQPIGIGWMPSINGSSDTTWRQRYPSASSLSATSVFSTQVEPLTHVSWRATLIVGAIEKTAADGRTAPEGCDRIDCAQTNRKQFSQEKPII